MSEFTKLKVQGSPVKGSYNDVPKIEFQITAADAGGERVDGAVVIWGRDSEKAASWEIGQIIEIKDGMTLEPQGPIKGGEFKGMQGFKLKWPKAAGSFGGRSFGGGRPPATEMDLDTYIGLKLTVYKEFHDGLTKIVDPRAYDAVATIAGTMANGTIMDMNIKPTVKGPKIPPPVEDKPPF